MTLKAGFPTGLKPFAWNVFISQYQTIDPRHHFRLKNTSLNAWCIVTYTNTLYRHIVEITMRIEWLVNSLF